ncbi:hypothetical protein LCGC14_1088960 [marine sediment metagenome]|uniref:Uncharacterized protein n=1 Tax=marine sediment metagenome TaxID=412755 RepID=A0A0F9N0Q4_9ZZZZ
MAVLGRTYCSQPVVVPAGVYQRVAGLSSKARAGGFSGSNGLEDATPPEARSGFDPATVTSKFAIVGAAGRACVGMAVTSDLPTRNRRILHLQNQL